MFTGLYPTFAKGAKWGPNSYYGLSRYQKEGEDPGLPRSVPTLSTWLSAKDYTCMGFNTNPYLLRKFGFGRHYLFYEDYYEENRPLDSYYPSAGTVLQQAAERIKAYQGQRFFLWIHLMDAHLPWNPPAEFFPDRERLGRINQGVVDLYKHQEELARARGTSCRDPITLFDLATSQKDIIEGFVLESQEAYEASVKYIDAELQAFLSRLEGIGILDEALLILGADHGEEFGEYGYLGHHHQGGASPILIRTPLLIHTPKSWQAQPQTISALSAGIDIAPTVLELLGEDGGTMLDGESLLPLLRGDTHQRGDAFHISLFNGIHTIWTEGYRYVSYLPESYTALFQVFDLYQEKEIHNPDPSVMRTFERMHEKFLASHATLDAEQAQFEDDICLDKEIERRLRGLGYL
jgi:arylsulfatase A-like enzyme